RHCLDDVCAGRPIDAVWREEVNRISHRPYSTGFYYGPPGEYYADSRYIRDWQVIALVTDCDADGNATLSLRNKFRVGDAVELVGPGLRPRPLTVPDALTDADGAPLSEPRTPQMIFHMKFPYRVPPLSMLRRYVGNCP
ncbi:MAG: U32 family peptidase C-terminal domain-containing protein, partial [Oscillibacter sp.]|nr:U32 family peptidase C-terminal domain-containing protein [Oscillibacter sp.]